MSDLENLVSRYGKNCGPELDTTRNSRHKVPAGTRNTTETVENTPYPSKVSDLTRSTRTLSRLTRLPRLPRLLPAPCEHAQCVLHALTQPSAKPVRIKLGYGSCAWSVTRNRI